MAIEVFIPKMTDHMEAAEIVQWLVAEGEWVGARQPILEVMTDKVAAEVESPAAGVLKGIRPGLGVGVVVPVGETIAYVAEQDETVPALPPLKATGAQSAPTPVASASVPSASPASGEDGMVRATPAARAAARALGVELGKVKGAGPGGRIREEDVRAFAEASKVSSVGVSAAGTDEDVDWVDLSPIQRLTGERMAESVRAPQFALSMSADAGNLLAAREAMAEGILAELGEKLSITALLVKAVAASLRRHPRLNASFEGGRLKLRRQVNIGVAVGTGQGLVVPVVRDADQKSLAHVVADLTAFREKASALRLGTLDLSGGTFTISNLGMYGVDQFTAIVNPPEAAILAVGRVAKTPVALPDDTIALRPLMKLTLSVDHRVADGMQASAFLADLKSQIETPHQPH